MQNRGSRHRRPKNGLSQFQFPYPGFIWARGEGAGVIKVDWPFAELYDKIQVVTSRQVKFAELYDAQFEAGVNKV